MGKFSSSSQKSRPLFLASLLASLALHAGSIYFLFQHPPSHQLKTAKPLAQGITCPETLNRLILKEENDELFLPAQSAFSQANEKIIEIISNLSNESEMPSLERLSQAGFEELGPLSCSTISFAPPAKSENAVNAEQKENPDLEFQPVCKIQEIQEISSESQDAWKNLNLSCEEQSGLSFSWDQHKAAPPQIISSKLVPKKQPPASLEEPEKEAEYLPQIEKIKNENFDRDSLYFFCTETSTTFPSKLTIVEQDAAELFASIPPFPKQNLDLPTTLGGNFFGAIQPLDLTAIVEIEENELFIPFIEETAITLFSVSDIAFTLPPFESSPPSLTLKKLDLSDLLPAQSFPKRVPYPPFCALKPSLTPPSPSWRINHSKEENLALERELKPLKEKDEPFFFSSKLPDPPQKKPSQTAISFLLSPQGPLLVSESWIPPKEELALSLSSLSIPDFLKPQKNAQCRQPSLKSETHPHKQNAAPPTYSKEVPSNPKIPKSEDSILPFAYSDPILPPSSSSQIARPHIELDPQISSWNIVKLINPKLTALKELAKPALLRRPHFQTLSMDFGLKTSLPKTSAPVLGASKPIPFAFSKSDIDIAKKTIAISPLAKLQRKNQLDFASLETKNPPSKNEKLTSGKPLIKQEKVKAFKQEIPSPQLSQMPPSEHPLLSFDTPDGIALKEQEFDYIKQKLGEKEALTPYVRAKKSLPEKVPFKPQNAFKDLSNVSDFLAQVKHEPEFSFIRSFTENAPLPISERLSNTQKALVFEQPKIDDIQSEAKDLLKQHEKETAQLANVELALPELANGINEYDVRAFNQTHRFTTGHLTEIQTPDQLETVSYSNEFETSVAYVPKPDRNGYYFAIKMKPSERLYFGSPEQNFIFIVDGSSSIKKHRYHAFKEAVAKSLAYMSEGDSYNILVADSRIDAISSHPIAWNKKASQNARNFLQKREFRGFFTKNDPFHLLSKATGYFDPDKENVIILITDGNSFGSIKKHKSELRELAERNKGRFSLFTASASKDNNLAMLDLISTFNQGEFMYSPTNASFPRKLAALVKHIESCIAKDIRIHTIRAGEEADVQFYPNSTALPALYADRPFILYGSVDTLQEFDLILQGRAGDQWINIKEHISFKNAELAGHKLKRDFALQQAYTCYDYYLKQSDPFFLAEAERILNLHEILPATR